MPHADLTCLELFSGAGGMSLGLGQAGIRVVRAMDNDAITVAAHNANLGGHCVLADARTSTGRSLLADTGLAAVDVVAGGPPCQGFSRQRRGAHLLDDPRNALARDYARIVLELRPRAFLLENVEAFGQARGRALVAEIRGSLSGYDVHESLVCSSGFGLAQSRGRYLMVGLRSDLGAPAPVLVSANTRVTVRDAIGDLPTPPADGSEHPGFTGHARSRITPLNEERFRHVPPGGGWADIPPALRLACHARATGSHGNWPDVYGRLEWDGLCPTVTAGFDSFTRGRYGHPEQHRPLTLREGARLQGFPDWFTFVGTRHDMRRQIGNAVPPPLAKAAGLAIARSLAVAGTGRMAA